ncbi:hypothetical protein [Pseudomonas haemolytica]|uniref:Uncharacterized protein n=1 Tax=Pseudomonas haemolytica TaxID=2600065 RepID=A0ABS1GMX2_9PSED|nr:hypothetical protein [Pseudomonas haemolytica]MBJ2245150.1 hypothetical protein [Pseudomonas haemolytica]MBJ2272486.1 hypothetical protein [Pseudomonas haemolytica]MBK3446823.1 hypothetical protein [Pseudomonas haemolytica]MBK3458318.1 hypothetical protein [Pseudomonas haemolytica]
MLGFSAYEIERLAELKRIKSDSVSQISEYWRRNMEADNNKRSNGRCSPLFWQWAVGGHTCTRKRERMDRRSQAMRARA